jgi:hypothetical protein
MDTNEHQDGMIAKYIASKGLPEAIEITCKRLAKFCASKLSREALSELSKEELVDLSRKGYFRSLREKARHDLRTAIITKAVSVDGKVYNAKRVEESWPEYRIALELKELDENGTHP